MKKKTLVFALFAIAIIISVALGYYYFRCDLCSKQSYKIKEIITVEEHSSGNKSSELILYKIGNTGYTFRIKCIATPDTNFKFSANSSPASGNDWIENFEIPTWGGFEEVSVIRIYQNSGSELYECKFN